MSLIFQKPPFNFQYQVGLANLVDSESDEVTVSAPSGGNALLHDLVAPARLFALDTQRAHAVCVGTTQNPGGTVLFTHVVNGVEVFNFTQAINALLRGFRMDMELIRRKSDLIITTVGYTEIAVLPTSPASNIALRQNRITLLSVDFEQPITIGFRVNAGVAVSTIVAQASWLSIH